MQEVILLACSTEGSITAWDLATGVALTQWKGNASGRQAFIRVGSDYLAAAQTLKDAVHFWAWHKEQVVQRSFAQERLTALAASPDGTFLAAGSASGTVYLWETPSGRLLLTWPAHYKAVTCLAFSDSGTVLVTGGEDTLVAAWALGALLDPAAHAPGQQRLAPLHTWSEHTLPVTSLCLGSGDATSVLVTAGLDRAVHIWALATGQLLRSVTLPDGVTSVALDPGEQVLYAGTLGGGIWEVPLAPPAPPGGGAAGPSAAAAAAAAAGAAAGGGGGEGFRCLAGHAKAVSSLQCSASCGALVSGSEDGTARVWDAASGQCLRVVVAPGRAPVTSALVAPLPPYLAGVGAGAAGARQGPRRAQPLAPLAKFVGVAAGGLRGWEGAPRLLDGGGGGVAVAQASGLLRAAPGAFGVGEEALGGGGSGAAAAAAASSAAAAAAAVADGGEGEDEVQALRQQVAELQQQLAGSQQQCREWQQLHARLHQFAAEQVLGSPMGGAVAVQEV